MPVAEVSSRQAYYSRPQKKASASGPLFRPDQAVDLDEEFGALPLRGANCPQLLPLQASLRA